MRPDSDEELDRKQAFAADLGRALAIAYRYLNSRERTVAEMRARLQRAELPEAVIDAAVDELVQFSYLNDARYAVVFTQDKRTLESWGNDRIARMLRERGVDRDLIDAALVEDAQAAGWRPGDADGASELERAVALLRQRFPAGPGNPKDRERAFGVLARKGYDSELAGDAVRAWARRSAT
jgi:regulatory protein